jgi:hypothetical protein
MFKLSFELSALCAGEEIHRERIQHHVRSGDRDRQLERSRHQACAHRRRAPERCAVGAADAGCLLQDLDAARSRRGAAYIKTAAPVRNQVPPPVYKAAMHAELIPNAERPIPEEACHIRRHRLQPRRGPAAVTMKPARDGLGEPPTSSRGNSTSANKHRLAATGPAFLDWNSSWIGLRAPTGAGAVAEAGSTRRPATIIGDERRLL